MRTILLLSALAALTLATPTPSPQDQIDYSAIDDTPDPTKLGPDVTDTTDPVTLNVTSVLYDAGILPIQKRDNPPAVKNRRQTGTGTPPTQKRDKSPATKNRRQIDVNAPCAPQPPGSGPVASPDTVAAFLANPALTNTATTATTPPGYVSSFTNLQASISEYGYMGLYTLTSYSTTQCAALCDANYPCQGFNLYFERDPTLNPSASSNCSNPASLTNIKCTLWGYPVTAGYATNTGQYRTDFHVVIAGSNGYNKLAFTPSPVPGWSGPVALPGAINAPSGYLGYKFFKDAFDPAICTAACTAQTAYNRRHPSGCTYNVCKFVNAYIMLLNGQPQGFYCSMYTQAWGPSYAVNTGQTRNGGADVYKVVDSFSYTNNTVDPGTVC